MNPMTYSASAPRALILSLTSMLVLSGCGLFGNINNQGQGYKNWVADYSIYEDGSSSSASANQGTALANNNQDTANTNTPNTNSDSSSGSNDLGTPMNTGNTPAAPSSQIVIEPIDDVEVVNDPVNVSSPQTTPVASTPSNDADDATQPANQDTTQPSSTVNTQDTQQPTASTADAQNTQPDVLNTSASSAVGNWQWPVDGGVLKRGFNPTGTGSKGVLIQSSVGQPVRAANSGDVVYVGYDLPGLGNLIIISHNNNIASGYGHVGSVNVKEGDTVQQGEKIALLEGINSQEPYLHFEIRENNNAVDPIQYVANP